MLAVALGHTDAVEARRFLLRESVTGRFLNNDFAAWVCQTISVWNTLNHRGEEVFSYPAIVNTIVCFTTGKTARTTMGHLITARNNTAASFAPDPNCDESNSDENEDNFDFAE